MPTNSGVTVAGNLLSSYGAYMQANPVISHIRDVETFQGRQRSTMLPVKNLITGMQLEAKIDFIGTASARAMNRSNFEALFRSQTDPVVIDVLDGFFYRAVLKSSTDCGTMYGGSHSAMRFLMASASALAPAFGRLSGNESPMQSIKFLFRFREYPPPRSP